ncbi:unnamed protein product [Didymodactylos carnosus]|nr:unnamed protein product [Didymodactylos carnosus]CAF4418797.1 unnamed protein product [Didymodactylos carnosus]
MAKKNDFIRIEEIGDAFRHSGQNPSTDVVKDMIDKAKTLKAPSDSFSEPDDKLSLADFLTVVHEYWYPIDEDKKILEEAFDVLDPERKSKLFVDDFRTLLKNSDWADEEIDLILSTVSCADGFFLYDDLMKLLLSPVELAKKKSAKGSGKEKKKA